MSKGFFKSGSAVLIVVLVWRVALLIFSAQPVPSNDAFFYDGPVVNFLLHGKYANPSLALALPISGKEVFCAYPPLYQLVLLGWMAVFGVSAISAMFLHLVLFGICIRLLGSIFGELKLPGWGGNIASLFLLVITFHDRPDSLAHVFGLAAIYSWTRARSAAMAPSATSLTGERPAPSRSWKVWHWLMVVFVILGLGTGLQIGGVYFLVVWIGTMTSAFFAKDDFPVLQMTASILVPIALVLLVAFGFPHLWEGFLEHARQTPSISGWRIPLAGEILKMIRTVPGVLAVAALAPRWFPRRNELEQAGEETVWLVTLACTAAALAIVVASMIVLTANSVFFASFLQPVIVGGYLAMMARRVEERGALPGLVRLQAAGFVGLAAIGAIRAIGMSTWGLACAADVGYPTAISIVKTELSNVRRGSPVVLSSGYLYEAARHSSDIRWIHSDWIVPAERGQNRDLEGLISLKPSKLILTQFDFYRRYEPILAELRSRPEVSEVGLTNTARIPPPDSFKSLQKVVQHISWAPIVVRLSWK